MTPDTEKGENEQLQSQPIEEGQSDWKDGEAPQEKLHQRELVDKQGADTQEPTFLNILVEVSTQIGIDELEAEIIPDFSEEVCSTTLEPSQGIELIERERQQQENEEVNQDVVTEEPTSLEISVEILRQ